MQAYIVAFGDSVRLDGPALLFLMLALRRAGLWQLAEACLLTELSQPGRTCAFSELADSIRGARTLKAEPPADAANVLLWKVQELFRERGLLEAAERGGALRRSALIHDALVTPCCNIVLQMYAEASPPEADRSLAFICAMARCSAPPTTACMHAPTCAPESQLALLTFCLHVMHQVCVITDRYSTLHAAQPARL